MRISAKADYAVRGMLELVASGAGEAQPVKGEAIAAAQAIPQRFLETIFSELRAHGLVHSRRGTEGGYWPGRDPRRITIAEIIRAVEGPLASVRGEGPETIEYTGSAVALRELWLALRANVREVLESVTLADLASGRLPEPVDSLATRREAVAPDPAA